MANKICDFCLEEGSGLFNQPTKIPDGHYICKNCRNTIKKYQLPLRHELFQILVNSPQNMQEMIITDHILNNTKEDIRARYFPLQNILLHEGEHCINARKASLKVDASKVPTTIAPTKIIDIDKSNITNLSDDNGTNTIDVHGMLYETDAALYFLSEHFINCHRLTSIVRTPITPDHIKVIEKGSTYSYQTENADLFFLRETLFNMTNTMKDSNKKNLIYLESENTMTITAGVYSVPKNVKAGTYYVSALEDKGIRVTDVNGKKHSIHNGRLRLDEGSQLEVTGEYQFRLRERTEEDLQNTISLKALSEKVLAETAEEDSNN